MDPVTLPGSCEERFGGGWGRRQMKGEVGALDLMSEKLSRGWGDHLYSDPAFC